MKGEIRMTKDKLDYGAFLAGKRERVEPVGFDVPDARGAL